MDEFIRSNYKVMEMPQASSFSMHTHNHYEIFCFLSGDADYSVEGHRYRLQRGDLMLMRKSEAHHLQLRSQARYERMYIHFDGDCLRDLDPEGRLLSPFHDRPLGKYNQFKASLFPDRLWRYYLEKICSYEDPDRKRYYLLTLLNELAECFEAVKASEQGQAPDRAAVVMNYINRHLTEELSLSILAERFNISKTYLNELFKQSAGTTVWHYVMVKRLVTARERIQAGETPTSVCTDCGFQDYTTFYRAYKQHFGVSPRADHPRKK